MTSMDELEARVRALEGEVGEIRADAVAARILVRGADREVAAFSGRLDMHQRLLEALRENQIDQGRELAEHGRELADHGRVLAEHGRELADLRREMREGFSTLAVGQAEILALLNRLSPDDPG